MNRLVVIGTSAGGLEALRMLVSGLPRDFPAPICIVMHTSPQSPGVLAEVLARAGDLPAVNVYSNERLHPGRIYVAPPDFHLVVEPGRVVPTKGPKENRFRPAIDPLFRSAAQVFGPAAIGVVMTGNLDDGTAGLWAIKKLGGIAIVQDPADALFPSMPQHALDHVQADHVVRLNLIAPLLVDLTASKITVPAEVHGSEQVEVEVKIAKEENPINAGLHKIAKPSPFACPECHGVLLEMREGGLVRFRCHTGHAYAVESLLAAIDEATDEAVWNAIRSLEEAGLLMAAMAEFARPNAARAQELLDRAADARTRAEQVRAVSLARTVFTANQN